MGALRILLVEDSPEDREVYRRLLAGAGAGAVAVEEEETGEGGLARLGREPFDCLLLDYQLPDIDGLEFLASLAAAGGPRPAVILLTGHGDESIAVEAMKRGAQDYLDKGRISGDRLLRSVQHAVEKVELERRVARHAEELQRAHDQLEDLVRLRTRELEEANAELRREVEERQRAEQEKAELLVREREARRDAEAASRLKDEFLATLSHELRTPLNAILGWSGILGREGIGSDVSARAVEVIERNARTQAQLISDLLDVSGIITGKMRLDLQRVELAPILQAVIDSVQPAADAKRIRLEMEVAPGLPALSADPARLQQVVWNLVANGVKFNTSGGWVRVRARACAEGVEITVEDDGIGIAGDFLPYVFERFRQRDSSPTRAHGGLGLGLAIVRHLVELHGGSVEAESEGDGRGAAFRVRLPRPPPADAAAADDVALAERAPALEGVRVLVVEDEADTRELCRLVLEEEGARVGLAASADAALGALREFRPDVLVSDIGLPGEDGYSLLRRVRALSGEQGGGVPAVAMTAYAGVADAGRAHAAGYDVHLPKPVTRDQLVAAVGRLARGEGAGSAPPAAAPDA
jgi:signal transduction histidine kinase